MFLPNESFFTQTISHSTEAATRGVLLFLEISQNSQENTSARVSLFFNKFAGLRSATLLKKRLISKNNFFYGTPLVAASVKSSLRRVFC